jgi:hypothetical protein
MGLESTQTKESPWYEKYNPAAGATRMAGGFGTAAGSQIGDWMYPTNSGAISKEEIAARSKKPLRGTPGSPIKTDSNGAMKPPISPPGPQ